MFKEARVPVMLLSLLVVIVLGLSDSKGYAESLKISAFRDISAFILDLMENQTGFPFVVKYVKNADEAHQDLKQGLADIVFMSYDDTLSIALQDGYSDIAAFMPIHGGILDLCGSLEPSAPRVGIDTDTGYARALRKFLMTRLGPARYSQLAWIKAGATDLRYQQLLDGKIDATLLNPPFSYRSGINRISALTRNDVIPTYQGVVANLNRSWLQTMDKTKLLSSFIAAYGHTIAFMQKQPQATIARLMSFYQLSEAEATAIYARLWAPDGLSRTTAFDPAALAGTEQVFAGDTGIKVPGNRTWVLDWNATNQYLDVATIPDVDGNGVSNQVLLVLRSGEYHLQIIGGADGKKKTVPLGSAANLRLSAMTVIPDENGDNIRDLAFLVLSEGTYSLRVYDGSTGIQLRKVSLGAAAKLTPTAITVVDDVNNNGYKDISILIKKPDLTSILQVRDALTLSLLKTIKLATK